MKTDPKTADGRIEDNSLSHPVTLTWAPRVGVSPKPVQGSNMPC